MLDRWRGRRPNLHNYVAIRFSLRLKQEWGQKAYGDETNRASWFAMRAALFKASLGASLKQQTIQPRRVFIFMDSSDVELWSRYLNLRSPYVPVFVPANRWDSDFAGLIDVERPQDVVISRIDSDDAIAKTYLEEVNKTALMARAVQDEKAYIVACAGFVTDLNRIQSIYYNCSPFISLYLQHYQGERIYDIEHERVLERRPFLNTTAQWMQIIHGSNLANRLRAQSRHEPGDHRQMKLGELRPIDSAWPVGFPRQLRAAVPQSTRPQSKPAALPNRPVALRGRVGSLVPSGFDAPAASRTAVSSKVLQ